MASLDKLDNLLGAQRKLEIARWDANRLQLLHERHDEIFHKMASDFQVVMVRNGVVHLLVSNPIWVSEIRRMKQLFLDKMNKVLGKQGYLLDIKVVFDQPKKASTEDPEVEIDANLSLEEKIKTHNQLRQERGETLCSECGQVYTLDECCVFCRTRV